MRPTELLRPPYRGATIGLIVAVGVSTYLIYRLADAGRPAATTVRLVNGAASPANVKTVTLASRPLLKEPLSLPPPVAGNGPPAHWDSPPVDLPPGVPVELRLSLAAGGTEQACELEPRPQGVCVVQARLDADRVLRCGFECRVAVAP